MKWGSKKSSLLHPSAFILHPLRTRPRRLRGTIAMKGIEAMETVNVREDYVLQYDGPGWYADLGRSFEGKSYVEGAKIASFDEFDQDGYCLDPQVDGGYIWDERTGRGTPYKLTEAPIVEAN